MKGVCIQDLASQVTEQRELVSDVCIVGAGAAGLYLARQLCGRRLRVIVLEAGGRDGKGPVESGFAAEPGESVYAGATDGRTFGLGGTTSRWGGVLAAPLSTDATGSGFDANAWREVIAHVDAHAASVLAVLGYRKPAEFAPTAVRRLGLAADRLQGSGINVQAALTLPFSRKNLAHLLGSSAKSGGAVDLFLHAEAVSWSIAEWDGKARITGVHARSPNGRRLRVSAGRVVVAAGALESARIVLEIDAAANAGILGHARTTGRFLSDHLSAAVAEVDAGGRGMARSLFAPAFDGAWMRPLRLIESDVASLGFRAFGHLVFDDHGSGFAVARDALRAWQQGARPRVSAASLMRAAGGLLRIASARYLHHRLYVSKTSSAHLQLDVEQCPSRENRVCLGSPESIGGRPRLRVEWAVRAADEERLHRGARRFLGAWRDAGDSLPALHELRLGDARSKPHDAYHPVGVCRLGMDAEATVDRQFQVHGTDNLHVLSTGILPTAGSANPTFALLCLAHSLSLRWPADGRT